MLVSVMLYDRAFMPFLRRATKNPRGISVLQRMGVGLVIHIVIMGMASVTERHCLAVAWEHGIVDSKDTTILLTIFVLLPQFVLMGATKLEYISTKECQMENIFISAFVSLRAFFQAKEERLLVYDYQPNGNLYSLIHASPDLPVVTNWGNGNQNPGYKHQLQYEKAWFGARVQCFSAYQNI
ncbi:hypothetical protein E2562_018243 [Oryza meyeriana var. granulata]|uniref:Uncharacterized protein n=1 Tax=Oryza meyeriana var. granulata TaxID=110450 RepID=A0A6G1CGN5_9ORYZ|nr:hypothetical protein E2562_018243 [Oryza meyeriana var. granulata]